MQIRPYIAGELIEQHGVIRVFTANHESTGQPVYLTLLPPDSEMESEWVNHLKRLRELSHPGILGFTNGRRGPDGTLYVITPALPGLRLTEAIPPDEVLDMAGQIAAALDYAHEHGIAHGHVHRSALVITAEGGFALRGFEALPQTATREAIKEDVAGLARLIAQALSGPKDRHGRSVPIPSRVRTVLADAVRGEFSSAGGLMEALRDPALWKVRRSVWKQGLIILSAAALIALLIFLIMMIIVFSAEVQSVRNDNGPIPTRDGTKVVMQTTAHSTETPSPRFQMSTLSVALVATETLPPIATQTAEPSATPTSTASLTASFTATPTATVTPSIVATASPTPTATLTHTPTFTLTPSATSTPLPTQTPSPTHTPTATLYPTFTLTPTLIPAEALTAPCIALVGDSVTHGGVTYEVPGVGYIVALAYPLSDYVNRELALRKITTLKAIDRGVSHTGISSRNHPNYYQTGTYMQLRQDNCRYTVIMPWLNDISPEIPAQPAAVRHLESLTAMVRVLTRENPYGRIIVFNYYYGATAPFALRTWASGFIPENVEIFNTQYEEVCIRGALAAYPQVVCADSNKVFEGMGIGHVIGPTTRKQLTESLAEPLSDKQNGWLDYYFRENPQGQLQGDGVHLSVVGKLVMSAYIIDMITSLPPVDPGKVQ